METLRPLGRPYNTDIASNDRLSPTQKYSRQLDADCADYTVSELIKLRELEFSTTEEQFISFETVENGLRRGFILKQEAFNKLPKAAKNKLLGELR